MNGRSRWFLKHPIQAKYLLIVLLAMLAPTLLMGFCLYHLVFRLLAQQISFPEAISANVVPVIERVNVILWIGMPILSVVMIFVALAISHRFAGPIERLESDLDDILSGQSSKRIRLRRQDDLGGVAERINQLLDRWKA